MSTSKRKRPRDYHHGDLRSATLLAAGELLEDQGVGGVVLREAARRAGVSHNAPYRHFADREALLAALAAEGFREFAASLEGRTGPDVGEAYVGFALAHPQRFRLMFGGQLRLDSDPALRAAAARAYEGLVATFQKRGDVANPDIAAAAAWSLLHGLATLLLDGHFTAATDNGRTVREFVRSVTGAVRFAGAAPQRSP